MSPPGVWRNDDPPEGEWEYEYDDYETEDFYFTLDLTTHVPDALIQSKQEEPDKQTPDIAGTGVQDDQPSLERETSPSPQGGEASAHEIQILDLHTTNPLVKLDDNIYSCYWSTDLGTQFHVAKAGAIDTPRYEGNVLDVIGISQTRLLGRPVSLQLREGYRQGTSEPATPENVVDMDDSSDVEPDVDDNPNDPVSNVLPAPGVPLVIPRELCKTSAGKDEADFLERLSAIKVKKGEYDPIAILGVKMYNGPSEIEQEAIRRQALEEDAAEARQAAMPKETTKDEPSKRRWKRRVNPETENADAQYRKRIYGKSGRVAYEDVRAGLGYQIEDGVHDDTSSDKND